MARLLAQKLNAVAVPKGMKNDYDAYEYGFLGSLKTKNRMKRMPMRLWLRVRSAAAVSRPIVSPCNAPSL